ncbi:hypothetical protein Tco_0040459 [Tanacetum coccineum]
MLHARALIEVWADVKLKDNIMVVMPKLVGEGFYTCNVRVEYEWKPLSKKKDVEPLKEVSNSNPFNVLNSVENDDDLGANGGSLSTTPIAEKINKIEKLIIDGQVTLVDDKGKPVEKVDYSGDHDSEDEVASVDNDMARSMRMMITTMTCTMMICQKIPNKIQAICDNLDIKVRGRKKK